MVNEAKITTVNTAVAVGGMTYSALTLNEWVALATLVYIVLQIFFLLFKWAMIFRSKNYD